MAQPPCTDYYPLSSLVVGIHPSLALHAPARPPWPQRRRPVLGERFPRPDENAVGVLEPVPESRAAFLHCILHGIAKAGGRRGCRSSICRLHVNCTLAVGGDGGLRSSGGAGHFGAMVCVLPRRRRSPAGRFPCRRVRVAARAHEWRRVAECAVDGDAPGPARRAHVAGGQYRRRLWGCASRGEGRGMNRSPPFTFDNRALTSYPRSQRILPESVLARANRARSLARDTER